MFDTPHWTIAAAMALALLAAGWAPASPPPIAVVLDNQKSTLLSISGAPRAGGSDPGPGAGFDVFAVGANSPDGHGPLLLRYHGGAWQRLSTGAEGDLWWVSDRPVDGTLFLCGSDGLILRLDPDSLLITREKAPAGKTLFGVWGTGLEDLWAVGGDLADPNKGGVVLRRSGSEWVADAGIAAVLPSGVPSIYKVWGRSPTEIYAVGLQGTALFYDGTHWSVIPTGITAPLFTVSGDATRVVATGGAFDGVILELEGGSFVNHAPPGESQINGVSVRDGAAVAVGLDGSVFWRGDQAWESRTPAQGAKPFDLHGAWLDPQGGIWAVGGDLTVDRSYGVVAYAGTAQIGHDLSTGMPCPPTQNSTSGTVSYAKDVYPLLKRTGCLDSGCHGNSPVNTDYDLRGYVSLFGPGSQAFNLKVCDVAPSNPASSYLLEKVKAAPRIGAQMPTGLPPLTGDEVQLLETWIQEGAVMDAPPSPSFLRGDPNNDGKADLSDAVAILSHLFLGGSDLGCLKAADEDDDGALSITDPIALLGYLFLGSPTSLPAPFLACGADPTEDSLPCETSSCR